MPTVLIHSLIPVTVSARVLNTSISRNQQKPNGYLPLISFLIVCCLCTCGEPTGASSEARMKEVRRAAHQAYFEDCWRQVDVTTRQGHRSVPGVSCSLTHVLGTKISADELISILKLRLIADQMHKRNPMSGDATATVYFISDILARAQVAEAVPVLAGLLRDPDPHIASSAAMSLIWMGNTDQALRSQIATIPFPESSIRGLHARQPDWLRVTQ